MKKSLVLAFLLSAVVIGSGLLATAQEQTAASDPAAAIHSHATSSSAGSADHASSPAGGAAVKPNTIAPSDENAMRIEGEKRYRANCARCHTAPRKFPPRTMATVIRHMRARAMLTDEDMRLILRYMSQ